MPPLPLVSGKVAIQVLEQAGFRIVRQKGSHCQLRHSDGRKTTVAVHGNKDIPRGTLSGVLKDIQMTPEEFISLL